MNVIHDAVELLEQLLLLLLDILVLLQSHLILPFDLLVLLLRLNNLPLFISKIVPHLVVLDLLVQELGYLFLDMFQWFDNHIIVCMLNHFLAISLILSSLLRFKVCSQRADHVHVETSDVVVVVTNLLVLLLVLLLELFNSSVFLGLNLGNLRLAPRLHVLSQTRHLCLVLLLDLTRDALVFLSLLS